MVTAASGSVQRTKTKLNSNQIKGFWAAWGGWTLDGMDAFIYALVLVPALNDLLPRSGIAVNAGTIGFYGSVLQALFLLGWGLSMVWGPIADRFGLKPFKPRIDLRLKNLLILFRRSLPLIELPLALEQSGFINEVKDLGQVLDLYHF